MWRRADAVRQSTTLNISVYEFQSTPSTTSPYSSISFCPMMARICQTGTASCTFRRVAVMYIVVQAQAHDFDAAWPERMQVWTCDPVTMARYNSHAEAMPCTSTG